jgi:hypothetical protein
VTLCHERVLAERNKFRRNFGLKSTQFDLS